MTIISLPHKNFERLLRAAQSQAKNKIGSPLDQHNLSQATYYRVKSCELLNLLGLAFRVTDSQIPISSWAALYQLAAAAILAVNPRPTSSEEKSLQVTSVAEKTDAFGWIQNRKIEFPYWIKKNDYDKLLAVRYFLDDNF